MDQESTVTVKAKKKWGQHFLRNRGAVERIVAAIEPEPDELIVEVGPGEGVLTEKVVELGRRVIAYEIDADLVLRLASRFPALEIREGDALDAELPSEPYRAVGNLPYNAGTPILRRIIADPHCRRGVFMVQKEVADRIVAKPGTEQYGFLTIYVQAYANAKTLMTLDPRSFHPPPKVRSTVVVLDPRTPELNVSREQVLDLASAAFRMRRKKLINNLIGYQGLTREDAAAAMAGAAIDANARAETMTLHDFDRLAAALLDRRARSRQ
jgi:16S rRNA (adenine1518-N6/adenine1519-N6)-dimethyltransferase